MNANPLVIDDASAGSNNLWHDDDDDGEACLRLYYHTEVMQESFNGRNLEVDPSSPSFSSFSLRQMNDVLS